MNKDNCTIRIYVNCFHKMRNCEKKESGNNDKESYVSMRTM